MNLSEMITFVRTHADTDETDAPDSSLTVYARAGYNDIRRRVAQWTDNHVSGTLTTVADTAGYALSALTGSYSLEYVTGISGPTEKLDYVTWDEYLYMVEGDDIEYSVREPGCYTIKNDTIYLFPTPSVSGVTHTVYGYRAFADWPSGSDEPDLPREFDEVICWYMLSKYYMAQEDVELASMYSQMYEVAVNRFIASSVRQDSHSPRIFGGKIRRRIGYDAWMRRNTEG